jgi:hypothetical protein
LDEIRQSIDAILAVDALYGQVRKWWQDATIRRGPARGLVARELQYLEALRVLSGDLDRVADFRRELHALADVGSEARRPVDVDLDRFESQLIAQKQTLLNGGWEAVFNRQKTLSARRSAGDAANSPGCRSALAVFEQLARQVRDAQSFEEAAAAYRDEVAACTEGD